MLKNEKDLGFIEDMITVLLNLVHIEEHSINSYFKTEDKTWLDINKEARKDRTELLDILTKKEDSEIWCFNKHLLTIILGYRELANRKDEKYFDKSKKWLGILYVKNKL